MKQTEPLAQPVVASMAGIDLHTGPRNPKGGAVMRGRADALRMKGDYERSIGAYSYALALFARDPDSFFGRGLSHHELGHIAQAIADYDEAARLRPNWSETYRLRAHARLAQGQLELAMADLRRGLQFDPKDVYYIAALGLVRLYTGDSEVAIDNLSRALQFKEDARTMLLLHMARVQNGEAASAELRANAERLRSKRWPYPLVEFYLGARSKADTLAAAATDEERCQAHYYAGRFLLQRGSKAEGLDLLTKAAQSCPSTLIEYGAAATDVKRHRR